jgi:xylose isomerase
MQISFRHLDCRSFSPFTNLAEIYIMTFTTNQRYAGRLNAFKIRAAEYWPGKNRISTNDLLARAATVDGLNAADLNYPDHFEDESPQELKQQLNDLGMSLNGLAMRYYTDPGFKLGAFTNPDAKVRQEAIDITLRGIDAMEEMGGSLMTLWMGQDGFDYSFQIDYKRAWDDTLEALAVVCDHNPNVDISLEYKPNEPRSFSLMPDVGANLLALSELNRQNTGITLDFAHVLYADEMPAHSAAMVNRYSRLLGVHLNDGYAKRDDGLMVGSVHPQQTVELLVEMIRGGYDSAIYFDTFPDLSGLDPVAEAETNVAVVRRLIAIAETLAESEPLQAAISQQNAPISQRLVSAALLGQPVT